MLAQVTKTAEEILNPPYRCILLSPLKHLSHWIIYDGYDAQKTNKTTQTSTSNFKISSLLGWSFPLIENSPCSSPLWLRLWSPQPTRQANLETNGATHSTIYQSQCHLFIANVEDYSLEIPPKGISIPHWDESPLNERMQEVPKIYITLGSFSLGW